MVSNRQPQQRWETVGLRRDLILTSSGERLANLKSRWLPPWLQRQVSSVLRSTRENLWPGDSLAVPTCFFVCFPLNCSNCLYSPLDAGFFARIAAALTSSTAQRKVCRAPRRERLWCLQRKSESCFVWRLAPDDDIPPQRSSNETLMSGLQRWIWWQRNVWRCYPEGLWAGKRSDGATKVEAKQAFSCYLSNKGFWP